MHYGAFESQLSSLLEKAVASSLTSLGIHPLTRLSDIKPEIDSPKERTHGDISTNVAMKACGTAGKDPLYFANLIKDNLEKALAASHLKNAIERIETRSPGFINFFLTKDYLYSGLLEIIRRKHNFGRNAIGGGIKVNLEFVSANPTGPLTIAHGRQAAVGDSLANILEFLGYRILREYYINDEGVQIDILANSIKFRYLELFGVNQKFPDDGYKGSYISEIASAFKNKYERKFIDTKDLKVFREFGLNRILQDIKKDLKDFGVKFDIWYSQRTLRKSGKVEKTIQFLKRKGRIYQKDDAVWFESTAFGDDKDRVVLKSDDTTTYLAPDIAYHLDKYRRGFKRLVDIWGPDHHGYIPRMKAAVKALGYLRVSFSALIVQLATLYRAGRVVSMSTRAGEFVTLRELMAEVGKDVARFCFLSRRLSSHLDFDLDVIKKESSENPVYYIQYAHARIWSILEHSKKAHYSARFDSKLLREEEELDILRILRRFPQAVSISGKTQEPNIILQYLQDLAAAFHSFYTKRRVLTDSVHLTKSRLVLVDCVRIVLANGLGLLGISLPKKM